MQVGSWEDDPGVGDSEAVDHGLLKAAFSQMGTALDAGGPLVQLFAEAELPTPQLSFGETIVESAEQSALLP